MPSSCASDGVAEYQQRPATLRLAFVAGDDFPFRLTVNRDLTGYTLAGQVLNTDTNSVACSFSTSIQTFTVAGVTSTRVTLSLTKTQTAALAALNLRWSFRWTAPDTTVRTLLIGRVQPVTR